MRQEVGGDATAGVRDGDARAVAGVDEPDIDPAARWRELHGIRQKVGDDLLQAGGVAAQAANAAVHEARQMNAACFGRRPLRVDGALDEPGGGDRRHLQ